MNVYLVEGGIGKHVAFTSLINTLAEKEKIIIVSGYPDIFDSHPLVEKSVSFDCPGFYDEYILNSKHNIIHSEPYLSDYIKNNKHIIECWCEQLGIKYNNFIPDIYVHENLDSEAKRFYKENGKFIIVQFCGGQSPLNFDRSPYYINSRFSQIKDYPRVLAQKVINNIKIRWPFLKILNFCLPNEEHYKLENCLTIQSPYLFYTVLLQYCESFISIDSSLQHFSGNRFLEKKGLVLWGATSAEKLGYAKNTNITNAKNDFHPMRPLTRPIGDIFNKDGSIWQNQDVQCLDIEPEVVIFEFEKTLSFNKNIKPCTKNIIKTKTIKKSSKKKIKKEQDNIPSNDLKEETTNTINQDIILLDNDTSFKLKELNEEIDSHKKIILDLSMKCSDLIEDYLKSNEIHGNFVLNDDCTKLVKINTGHSV